MSEFNYDVVFIGSGHAAWHAAVTLGQAGKSVAIVEEDLLLGTCTNYGCNAKILLDGPADIMHQAKSYQDAGMMTGELGINWEKLMGYKQTILSPERIGAGITKVFESVGITIINGHGKLTGQHEIDVNGEAITADQIVLASGQRPARLKIAGQELLHDSRDFLDLPHMPAHITFIGAGVISMEFADLATQAGAKVDIVEFGDRALAGFHQPYVDKVVAGMQAQGVQFHFGEEVTSVSGNDADLTVSTKSGLQIRTSYVLDATGRIPNVETLGLDDLGIKYNRRGIIVDDHLRTNVDNIFASGDVVDKTQAKLTPTATFESNYIAKQILGIESGSITYPAIPSVVFTLPRLSQSGVTIEEAQADGDKYTILPIAYGQQMLFETKNEIEAELTAVLDQAGHLVGATVISNDAPAIINALTMIINQKLTVDELDNMIFAFPDTSVAVLDLLRMGMRQVKMQ